jgi:hypothetical protein
MPDANPVINEEHTLLSYLSWTGQDHGTDYDDGLEGYFSWSVKNDVLTVNWRAYDDFGKELGLITRSWLLSPELGGEDDDASGC